MKLLLLRVLLQRRARDEGFTLPMVIALGLVMVLLGATNIVKSSEENLNATIQNSSSDALAIAEVGITKYREFLNQNRILTVYNHAQWTSDDVGGVDVVGQTCSDLTTTPTGWEDDGTTASPNDTTKWWQIEEDIDNGTAGDETIGEYRLVSYIYDNDGDITTDDNGDFNNLADANTDDDPVPVGAPAPPAPIGSITDENDTDDDGESDARGILTIQGKSPDGSVAQIQAQIPLRINSDEMNNLAPAIWIGNGDTSKLGTLTIPSDSNIVLTDGGSGCSDPADIAGNSVISEARGIASITSIDTKLTDAGANINQPGSSFPANLGTTSANPFVTPPGGSTFDASVHCSNISDCRYYYKFSGNTDVNVVTQTDGIAKVTVYVEDGDLDIDEDILGSGISSNYLEIYVKGNQDITIDSDNVNTVKALIHAPESKLEVTGSGTVNIIGSVWVDEFDNNATVNFGVEQSPGNFVTETTKISSKTSVPTYEVYTTTGSRTPRPLTSSPTNWVREEAQ